MRSQQGDPGAYEVPVGGPWSIPYEVPAGGPWSVPYEVPAGGPWSVPYEVPAGRLWSIPYEVQAGGPWSIPYEVPAGITIVADCNSESYRIAEYIDYFPHIIFLHCPQNITAT